MIAADAPITHERALADLRIMLYAAQHARSVMAENGWADDEVGKRILADCQPWLWKDDQAIVLPLVGIIQRAERNGGKVQPIDYYNMLVIAQKTPAIAVGALVMHERELPEPTLDVFKALV
jgi:hypothetical protein